MGQTLSSAFAAPKAAPPKLVLVPPMFQRDLKARSRFARSSYDYLFAKPQLKWLFTDFLPTPGPGPAPGLHGVLFLSPPADQHLSVKAKVGTNHGSMCLRLQPLGPDHRNAFLDLKANLQDARELALRACYFDIASGAGAFATVPLARHLSTESAQVGVRYSTADLSAGAIMSPTDQRLASVWVAARQGAVTFGAQTRPNVGLSRLGDVLGGAGGGGGKSTGRWLQERTCCALSYSPQFSGPTSRGNFTASVEVQEGRALLLSFYQHMAVSRRTVNPFEDGKVVGITNYINIGVQLVTPLGSPTSPAAAVRPAATVGGNGNGGGGSHSSPTTSSSSDVAQAAAVPLDADDAPSPLPAAAPGIHIAAEWQVNKNWLLKARLGTTGAALAVGLRSWFDPSVALAACVQYDYVTGRPKFGFQVQAENHGARLYEKGVGEAHGKALVQRHEAQPIDIRNFEGEGPLVLKTAGELDYNVAATSGANIL